MESVTPSANATEKERTWTEEEDTQLVHALLDIHNEGKYNADRGFKSGHYNAVERKLLTSLPNSGLKANPHITSRMKTLKAHFNAVHDMISGNNTSGFGYDDAKQCVVVEKAVWDEYLKVHKNAKIFKDKPFPHYRDLCTIFGKDRATSNDAIAPEDVLEEIVKETQTNIENENDVEGDSLDGIDASMSFVQTPSVGNTSEANSKKERKRGNQGVEDMICEVVTSSAAIISLKMETSSEQLSWAIEDTMINDLKRMFNGELMKATVRIACDRDLTQIFFTIDDNEKEEWVKAIIS